MRRMLIFAGLAIWFAMFAAMEARAECIDQDDMSVLLAGDFPQELIWKRVHYSRICECGGSTSGAGHPDNASRGLYCPIGRVCRCGTFNGRPMMGKIVSQARNSVPDYGMTQKEWDRDKGFGPEAVERDIARRLMGCNLKENDRGPGYRCNLPEGSDLELRRASATLNWTNRVNTEILRRFANVYGGSGKEKLFKLGSKSSAAEGRLQTSECLSGVLKGTLYYLRFNVGDDARYSLVVTHSPGC